MGRVACYVDGFNLFHALDALNKPHLKWLNLKDLALSMCRADEDLVAIYYFTAVHTHDAAKCRKHKRYIEALEAVGVTIVISKFQSADKYCRKNDCHCPFLEEKQTDVALATTFLADAMENFMDRAIIVTADSDQIPAVKAVSKRRPLIQITLAAPPGRLKQSRQLGAHIPDHLELSEGRIGTCRLPRTVYKEDGRAASSCPSSWLIEAQP